MLDTRQQRGMAITTVGLALAVVAHGMGELGQRLVGAESEAAAQELVDVVLGFGSVADLQLAMATGDVDLPAGASLGFDDGLQVVASKEVSALTEIRCVRVEASAPDVDSALQVDATAVFHRPCGR